MPCFDHPASTVHPPTAACLSSYPILRPLPSASLMPSTLCTVFIHPCCLTPATPQLSLLLQLLITILKPRIYITALQCAAMWARVQLRALSRWRVRRGRALARNLQPAQLVRVTRHGLRQATRTVCRGLASCGRVLIRPCTLALGCCARLGGMASKPKVAPAGGARGAAASKKMGGGLASPLNLSTNKLGSKSENGMPRCDDGAGNECVTPAVAISRQLSSATVITVVELPGGEEGVVGASPMHMHPAGSYLRFMGAAPQRGQSPAPDAVADAGAGMVRETGAGMDGLQDVHGTVHGSPEQVTGATEGARQEPLLLHSPFARARGEQMDPSAVTGLQGAHARSSLRLYTSHNSQQGVPSALFPIDSTQQLLPTMSSSGQSGAVGAGAATALGLGQGPRRRHGAGVGTAGKAGSKSQKPKQGSPDPRAKSGHSRGQNKTCDHNREVQLEIDQQRLQFAPYEALPWQEALTRRLARMAAACVVVLALNMAVVFFTFGVLLITLRFVFQSACNAVLRKLFDITGGWGRMACTACLCCTVLLVCTSVPLASFAACTCWQPCCGGCAAGALAVHGACSHSSLPCIVEPTAPSCAVVADTCERTQHAHVHSNSRMDITRTCTHHCRRERRVPGHRQPGPGLPGSGHDLWGRSGCCLWRVAWAADPVHRVCWRCLHGCTLTVFGPRGAAQIVCSFTCCLLFGRPKKLPAGFLVLAEQVLEIFKDHCFLATWGIALAWGKAT